MQPTDSFSEVLEAIDLLSLDEQETLLDIITKRIHERGRKQLKADIEQARNSTLSDSFTRRLRSSGV